MFFTPVHTNVYCAPSTAHNTARSFDRSFERFANQALRANAQKSLSVEQDEQSWTLSLDVPGVTREELTIGIEANVVRIDSKADAKRAVKAAYEFPLEIDTANSLAKLENGVLTLKLGKKVPVANVTELTIS